MITPDARMSSDSSDWHDEEPTPEDWEVIRDVARALEFEEPTITTVLPDDPYECWSRIAEALETLAEMAIQQNELIEVLLKTLPLSNSEKENV